MEPAARRSHRTVSLQRRGAGSVTRGGPQPLPGLREPVGFAGRDANEVVVDFGCGGGIDVILAAHKVGPAGCVGAFSEKYYFETVRQAGVEHLSVVSEYPSPRASWTSWHPARGQNSRPSQLKPTSTPCRARSPTSSSRLTGPGSPGPGDAVGQLRLRRSLRSRPAIGWSAIGSTQCLERRRSPLYS